MKQLVLFAVGIMLFSCGKKQETSLPSLGPITESIYASGVTTVHEVVASSHEYIWPSVGISTGAFQ